MGEKGLGGLIGVFIMKFSVVVNRTPDGFFLTYKNLREGDPPSSFLFILAIEEISLMMCKANSLNWPKGLV